MLSKNKRLVRGSECFPRRVQSELESRIPSCEGLPTATKVTKGKSVFVVDNNLKVKWFAMAFSSVNIAIASFFIRKFSFHIMHFLLKCLNLYDIKLINSTRLRFNKITSSCVARCLDKSRFCYLPLRDKKGFGIGIQEML